MPKILIFSNNPADGELYKEWFVTTGFEARTFYSYVNPYVVDSVVMEQPNVLICDVVLGQTEKINGFQAIRLLKSDTRTKGTPIIIVSDLCDVRSMEAGLKTGAEKFLCSKEYTPEKIVEVVKNFL